MAFYFFLCITSANTIIDDAYISFNYAKNFSEHGKPWYNLDPYFQGNGQTSLLWMWILAVFNSFNCKPEFSFMWLNIGMGSFLIIKLVKLLTSGNQKIWLTLFNFSFACFFIYWLYLNSIHGLETVLAALTLYLFIKNWEKNNNYYALILTIVRPEFGLFLIFWVLRCKLFSRDFFKRFFISFIGVAIFVVYYLLFFDYYLLLPLLYKSEFKEYTLAGVFVYLGILLIFIPVFITLFQWNKFSLLIAINLLIFYYIFNVRSYSSGIFYRYLFPLISLYLVFGISVWKTSKYHTFFKAATYTFMVFAVFRMIDLSKNFHQQKKEILSTHPAFYKSYRNLIKLLKPEDKVTINDAGFAAYFSDATCYDGVGLNDATIMLARKNNDKKGYKNYIKRKKINYVSIGSTSKNQLKPRYGGEEFITESLNLEKFQPYQVFPMDRGFYLFVYKFENGYQ